MKDSVLLDHIAKQPHGKTSLKHLFKELRAKGDDRAGIEAAIERLTSRGDLIQLSNMHYVATSKSREFAAGRVSMHRDGYGFLIPDHPVPGVQGDIYIGRDHTRGAMHGDRAIARITHSGANGRTEGEIQQILKHNIASRILEESCWQITKPSRSYLSEGSPESLRRVREVLANSSDTNPLNCR